LGQKEIDRVTVSLRLFSIAALLIGLSTAAGAGPVLWTFSGATLTDGGTITGSFDFDADTNTYSNVNVVTSLGSVLGGSAYSFVCGQDVASCTGLAPNSTEALLLTSNAADQTGLPAIALFFTGVGAVPPAGLTDAGGIIDISNTSLSVGAAQEAACSNAACSAPAPPGRFTNAGDVATPEPSTFGLLAAGFAVIAAFARRAARHR
jgi:PEP-CTERM motif